MKKLLLLIFVIAITAGAYAQIVTASADLRTADVYTVPDSVSSSHADGYMMKDGKMVIVKNGKFTLLEKDITFPNGTVLISTGSYTEKSGTKKVFTEGEHIDNMGKITPVNVLKDANKDKDLKPAESKELNTVPDSPKPLK